MRGRALKPAVIFYGSFTSRPARCNSLMRSLDSHTALAAPSKAIIHEEKSFDGDLSLTSSSADAAGAEQDRIAAVLGRRQIPWAVKGVAFLLVITFNRECFPSLSGRGSAGARAAEGAQI